MKLDLEIKKVDNTFVCMREKNIKEKKTLEREM